VILSLQFNGFVYLGNTVPVCSFLLSHKSIVFRLILKISLTSPFFRPSISIAVMTFCLKSSPYGFAIPVAIHFFYSALCPNSFGYCHSIILISGLLLSQIKSDRQKEILEPSHLRLEQQDGGGFSGL
jgi:hypothetical protein